MLADLNNRVKSLSTWTIETEIKLDYLKKKSILKPVEINIFKRNTMVIFWKTRRRTNALLFTRQWSSISIIWKLHLSSYEACRTLFTFSPRAQMSLIFQDSYHVCCLSCNIILQFTPQTSFFRQSLLYICIWNHDVMV